MANNRGGWYGVDLDGCLAFHTGPVWNDDGTVHIGPPIPAMAERVKAHLRRGDEVRILTARVSNFSTEKAAADLVKQSNAIGEWTEKVFGKALASQAHKDYTMIALYDDRAIQIEHNTGRRMDGDTAADEALLRTGE